MKRALLFMLFAAMVSRAAGQSYVNNNPVVENLTAHLYTLAADSLEGRRAGSAGGHMAAEYIAAQFRGIGLEPLTDSTYMMPFGTVRGGEIRNVVGVIRGNNPELAHEAIIVGAHYDHLGAKEGAYGRKIVYNGADDNASGTAAMIEVARKLKEKEGGLTRTVVFVAFDAEEAGLYGSKAMVKAMIGDEGYLRPKLMVNMDMVGWLEKGGRLRVAGVAMLKDGKKIMAELGTPEGLDVKLKNFDKMVMGGSDHDPFATEKIPAFYLTTGMKSPYHKPEDTAEKIDYDGLALVTEYVAGVAGEFADRSTVEASGRISPKHKGQSALEWGLTAAIGSSNHLYHRKSALTGKAGFAWNAGLYAQVNLSIMALRPKVLYENRIARWPVTDASGAIDFERSARLSLQSVSVPLDIMFKSSVTSGSYSYIFAGAYWSRILGAKLPEGTPGFDSVRKNEWGWRVGFGGSFQRIIIELTALRAFKPVFDESYSPHVRNYALYFTMGYKF